MAQISYNDALRLYLMTFVCVSLQPDQQGVLQPYQAAWYFSTATSLDSQNWTAPQTIENSQFPVTQGCGGGSGRSFDGWYPSFMSPGSAAGNTSSSGHVFFMNGCDIGARTFMARTFTITAPPPVVNLSITPVDLNFGNIYIGQSANQTITITNETSSTGVLTGDVGTLSDPFSVVSGGAFNLAPGQSVTVTVRYSPTTSGPASANLSITHNATNQTSPTKISLSGTGVSSTVLVISVTSTSNDYGNVKVKKSKAVSFVVKNSGKANLSITSAITGIDASMFTITSGAGSKTIKPGKTLTIKVAFKPASTGSKSAILEIDSNDPSTPILDISLIGTGQ